MKWHRFLMMKKTKDILLMNSLCQDLSFIIKEARDEIEKLAGKSLFITGGTGFFGKWILESLVFANQKLTKKTDITVLSRNPDLFVKHHPHISRGIKFVHGDIENFKFPQGEFNYIIHAATQASADLNYSKPEFVLNNIIKGTERVLEFAREKKVEGCIAY